MPKMKNCIIVDLRASQKLEIIAMSDAVLEKELAFARGFAPPTSIAEEMWLDLLETENSSRNS